MSDELLWTASAFAALAGVALVALVGLAIYLAITKKRWLPLQRLRPGRWAGYEVLLAFCVVYGLPSLIVVALIQIGFFTPLFGDPPKMDAAGPAAQSYFLRCGNVAGPLTLALALGILFLGLYVRSQTRPHHYGLSWARWPANLALGIAAFLIATPVVLGLHALIMLGQKDNRLDEFATRMQSWEWLFFIFQVVLRAPVLEEILFRGIVLGWLRRASLGGHVGIGAATIFIAVWQTSDTANTVDYYGPGVFAAFCTAGYAFWMFCLARRFRLNGSEFLQWQVDDERRRQDWARQNALLAVYGSAMLFAVGHTSMWPAPVALLFLGLVLGWLALRTQSLIGPITLHALFNLVSFIALYATT